jgi:CheY-like chemotaxis protein
LRAPLASIVQAGETLGGVAASITVEQLLHEIADYRERAQQLLNLIDQLLAVSRVHSALADIDPTSIELTHLFAYLEQIFSTRATEESLELRFEMSDLVRLVVDVNKIRDCLSNLIDNALKFTPPGGTVEISAWTLDERIHIAVTDTGPGIAAGSERKIFAPFTQDKYKGVTNRNVGLGLWLAKSYAVMHQGQLNYHKGQNGGSVFELVLPPSCVFASNVQTRESVTPSHGHSLPLLRSHRILLVDDKAEDSKNAAELLRRAGRDVLVASNGAEAIAKAVNFCPELILLDIVLNDESGIDLVADLRATSSSRMNIVAFTAGKITPAELAAHGFDGVIEKPLLNSAIPDVRG